MLLYALATGERPYGNPTTVHGLRRRLYRDPVPPRARAPGVPPWLQEIILHCLEVEARNRLQGEPGARLAFVTVLKTSRIAMDINVDEEGRNLHVRRLVDLKQWLRALELPPSKVTYHVLEAPDPAAAILAFARANRVDQIVIGSRGSSTLRRYLGSVSSHVVAQAPCTVTVVRAGADAPSTVEKTPAPEDLYFD